MAGVNPVPKLYSSIIEDVIEGVRDLFAEEGVEEQVLKDLKQLWEAKVLQSGATTEDFPGSRTHLPALAFPLSPALLQPGQPAAASFIIPAGGTLPGFTTAELATSNSGASFTLPGYPVPVPAAVALQTASGHLYKVNIPIMVAQTSGRPGVVQHPVQPVFQPLGQPSVVQTGVPPPLNPSSLPAAVDRCQKIEAVLQQPTVLHAGLAAPTHLEYVPHGGLVPPGNEPELLSEAVWSLPEHTQYPGLSGVVLPPQALQACGTTVRLMGSFLCIRNSGVDVIPQNNQEKKPAAPPHPRRRVVFSQTSDFQVDLSIQVTDDDSNGIIQVDGTGNRSSSEELGSMNDVDENEFLGIIDAGDLKVLEEEADSMSNEDSIANSSDSEDPQVDIVEEDPLNSGDDVSEQDVPDLFDTDNVIVCQYDKIHRNKNKWKFFLKDGVMCFGGRDYVFSKAIGDAEW
ncbi:TFIIA-alpha and beta-like factor [Ctenodactylus gundi]